MGRNWRKPLYLVPLLLIMLTFLSCNKNSEMIPTLILKSLQIENVNLLDGQIDNVAINPSIIASFNYSIDTTSFRTALSIVNQDNNEITYRLNYSNEFKNVVIYPLETLETYTLYSIKISNQLVGSNENKFSPVEYQFKTHQGKLLLKSVTAGDIDLMSTGKITNAPLDLQIVATFSDDLDMESINFQNVRLKWNSISLVLNRSVDGNKLIIDPLDEIRDLSTYELELGTTIAGPGAVDFDGFNSTFITKLDSTLKFPEISDDDLLTKIQEQTFKYFWDFGHPVSGLTRERNTSGETVTSGGSGFGLMAIIVGIERGFITRAQGVERWNTIVDFLLNDSDRFHGAWSHWLNGTSGQVIPFSTKDNGGDLVETSYMAMGLLTVRQYLDPNITEEQTLIDNINTLWEGIEWDWYTQGQNQLYWHWSPNYNFEMNMPVRGWNEALITHVLAASSPTHSVAPSVYNNGWALNGGIANGKEFYGFTLPLGPDYGGPLFFEQYTFLGLNPTNLSDQYASYWEQVVNHSKINHAYCVANPKNWIGYNDACWGLTASDNQSGYSAHSPTNDKGVITPTAAVSSLPFTPEESMKALRYFYYILGDRTWGEYGFYDAFNITENWYASSFLAIDQGPIILMIENYRTGLLWNLFMSNPEVQNGLDALGFTY